MRRDLLTADARLGKVVGDLSQADTRPLRCAPGRTESKSHAGVRPPQAGTLALHGVVLVALLATTLLARAPRAGARAPRRRVAGPARPADATNLDSSRVDVVVRCRLYPYAPIFLASLFGVLGIAPMTRLFRGRRPASPASSDAARTPATHLHVRRFLPPFVPIARIVLIGESIGASRPLV